MLCGEITPGYCDIFTEYINTMRAPAALPVSTYRRCSIPITFQLWFNVRHYEGLGIQEWLKINGTNQHEVYFDDASILGGRLRML
jgi:hypothetical protein